MASGTSSLSRLIRRAAIAARPLLANELRGGGGGRLPDAALPGAQRAVAAAPPPSLPPRAPFSSFASSRFRPLASSALGSLRHAPQAFRPYELRATSPVSMSVAAALARPAAKAPDQRQFLDRVTEHMGAAIDRAELTPSQRKKIMTPERTIAVHFPVTMDDGRVESFDGWRIVHNTRRGPGKGGIRFAPGLGEETVSALAFEMPNKPSIYGLPLGGAKGGVDVDPRKMSTAELARVMRGYVRAVLDEGWRSHLGSDGRRLIAFGPEVDVPAPDVGTSPPEIDLMAVATDEYLGWVSAKKTANAIDQVGRHPVPDLREVVPSGDGTDTPYLDAYLDMHERGAIQAPALAATFTGKGVEKGGSHGRSAATGLGVAYSTLEMMKHDGLLPPEAERFTGQAVAIQGFGNVGIGAARSFEELGAKVVAIAEHDGAPYALTAPPEGLDRPTIDAMVEFKRQHKTLRGFPGLVDVPFECFWEMGDILAPCARENELTLERARRVKARYIVEGANGPTASDAVPYLRKADRVSPSGEHYGITVIPDIFANAGGVTVSYLEMEQNLSGHYWTEDEVQKMFYADLKTAFAPLVESNRKFGYSLRDAAYLRAVQGLV